MRGSRKGSRKGTFYFLKKPECPLFVSPTADDLTSNLDTIRGKEVPPNFDKEKLQKIIDDWNHGG